MLLMMLVLIQFSSCRHCSHEIVREINNKRFHGAFIKIGNQVDLVSKMVYKLARDYHYKHKTGACEDYDSNFIFDKSKKKILFNECLEINPETDSDSKGDSQNYKNAAKFLIKKWLEQSADYCYPAELAELGDSPRKIKKLKIDRKVERFLTVVSKRVKYISCSCIANNHEYAKVTKMYISCATDEEFYDKYKQFKTKDAVFSYYNFKKLLEEVDFEVVPKTCGDPKHLGKEFMRQVNAVRGQYRRQFDIENPNKGVVRKAKDILFTLPYDCKLENIQNYHDEVAAYCAYGERGRVFHKDYLLFWGFKRWLSDAKEFSYPGENSQIGTCGGEPAQVEEFEGNRFVAIVAEATTDMACVGSLHQVSPTHEQNRIVCLFVQDYLRATDLAKYVLFNESFYQFLKINEATKDLEIKKCVLVENPANSTDDSISISPNTVNSQTNNDRAISSEFPNISDMTDESSSISYKVTSINQQKKEKQKSCAFQRYITSIILSLVLYLHVLHVSCDNIGIF